VALQPPSISHTGSNPVLTTKTNKMENNNFYEALKHYFDTTPKDKVLEDWDKSAEHDKIGVTVEEFLDNTKKQETLEEVKDLDFWRNNAEEDYLKVPISVLRYISELESQQERMYSEEEVFNMLMNFWKEERPDFKTNPVCVSNWFEQFKKK
jgi:hypothetical protein